MTGQQCAPDRRCSEGSGLMRALPALLLVLVMLARSVRAEPQQPQQLQPLHQKQPQQQPQLQPGSLLQPQRLPPCVFASMPRASPRSSSTHLWPVVGTRRGYYGHDVGYGSYFPVGLDPLTILAGLAFLAFIIQTLYLLLYKHYGLGIGAGAGVGLGPLSADRHHRQEEQAWASSIANRIETASQAYENNASSEHRTDPPVEVLLESAESRADADEGVVRQLGRLGPSPLDALLSMVRRSWGAPGARTCGSSWLCRLVHFARMLTEPLRPTLRARRRANQ